MSYILDALKRADADRERDTAAVPDLHAQADAARGVLAAARPSHGWLMTLALAAAGVALAALAWRWLDASPADAAPPLPVAQAPAQGQALAPSTPALAPAATIIPAAPPLDASVPLVAPAIAPEPAPIPSLASKPALPPRQPAAAATPAVVAAAPAVAGRPSAPASAAAESRIYSMAELSPDIRSGLPALTVGGSVYSPKAASRIVILNGQVFREGDKPVDGLIVERIGLKSTVLAFRGTRFELKH